jgi:hypothetical protein
MAFSGSGGAYYRSNAVLPNSTFFLSNNYTIHLWVKSSIAAGTSNFRIARGLVGTSANEPHEQLAWCHTSASFNGSNYHRNSNAVYAAAKMTNANLTTNTWHSVGAVFTGGGNIVSYLNGVADGSAGASFSDARDVYVDLLASISSGGTLDLSSQFAEGEVAEYAVWSQPLTAAEMVTLAKGFRAFRVRPQHLCFYAPLVRSLIDAKGGRTLVAVAGSDANADHPRMMP